VVNLPAQPANLTNELNPPDDGFGSPGGSTFNVPCLEEAAGTGPFFHNNSVEMIEGALDATQIVAIAAFLRVINTLENIRLGKELLNSFVKRTFLGDEAFDHLLQRAGDKTNSTIRVLAADGLHPAAVMN
jgi:hypothetical protein